MGEDDATPIGIGVELAGLLAEHGLQPTSSVLDVGCGYALRAIAFEEGLVRTLIRQAGLEVVVVESGTWAGEPGHVFQDLVAMRRPESGWLRADTS